eukprot:TRINITY_DN852_c0_g1_i1.p1 TRINITY_DN852_c0_g1~~TRINITY_DN852_c0_g1_i1.p1  ORF type:complete len:292 (-),score=38.32 TRINITY_DN852_c0_g1_i1:2469-3233(-)
MSKLEQGPHGVDDACAEIDRCARESSSTLDLQQMMLTNDDMSVISKQFERVAQHVTHLNIFMNDITVLPAAIAKLSNLQVLLAGCNPLTAIEHELLQGLPKLQQLDIGFSETLEEIPDAFHGCHALKILQAGNGKLKSIPPSVFRCENLEELHVYGNSIKHISDEIGCLRSLRVLNAGRNQISKLPDSICTCASLEVLHVYENCLSALPSDLSKLEKLKTLNVDFNADLPTPPIPVRCASSVQAVAAFHANGAS